MDRQLAAEFVSATRGFDGIDVADQVGDGDVRRRQFFHISLVGRQVGDRRVVAMLGDQVAAAAADRSVGIVVNLASGDVGHAADRATWSARAGCGSWPGRAIRAE